MKSIPDIETLSLAVQEAHRSLAIALADNSDAQTVAKCRKTLDMARQAHADGIAIGQVLQQRSEAGEQAAKKEQIAAAWAKAKELAQRRIEAAKQIEHHATAMGRHYTDLLETTAEISAIVPGKVDEDTAMTIHPLVASAVRECLQLHGVTAGMPSLPFSNWELSLRPALSDRIRAASQYLEGRHHG